MKKTIFGIATVLALTTTSAFASDAKSNEEVARDSRASQDTTREDKGAIATTSHRGAVRVARADAGTNGKSGSSGMSAVDVSAPHAERWLVERQGYRDGGY